MIGFVYSSNNKKIKSGLSLIHVEISPNNEKLILILAFLFILFSWYSSQPQNVSQKSTGSSYSVMNGGSSYSGMNESSFMSTGYMDNNKKSEPKKFNLVSGLDNVFDKDSELVKNISNTVGDIPKLIEQNIKGLIPTIDENSSLINVKVI
jgi:hypothetical protein